MQLVQAGAVALSPEDFQVIPSATNAVGDVAEGSSVAAQGL